MRVFAVEGLQGPAPIVGVVHASAFFFGPRDWSVRVSRMFTLDSDNVTRELPSSVSVPRNGEEGYKSLSMSTELAVSFFRSAQFKLFKTRYHSSSGIDWTVDMYRLENEPLILAYARNVGSLPSWLDRRRCRDVSDDRRYSEFFLSRQPYSSWRP